MDKLRNMMSRKADGTTGAAPAITPADTEAQQTTTVTQDKESGHPNEILEKNIDDAEPDPGAQLGVQKIEAITLTWDKKWLAALLVNIWFLFLVNGFRLSAFGSLVPYITSDFQTHSLLAVIYVVSSSISAAVYIPMAKLLDTWGRAEGFLLMVASSTLGLIIMAASTNLGTFCAAQIFYSIGFSGIIYTIAVLAADATSLRNRGLAFAFTSSPYMITAFAGSKAAEGFVNDVSWQWGVGCFAIIVPIVSSPLWFILKMNLRKAEREGVIVREKVGKFDVASFWKGVKDFDILGCFLFAAGLVIFLVPFTIATSAPNGWASGYIIAMIVLGFFLLVVFALYEIYLAPVPFLKGRFLTDRTVVGACLINITYQISYYCWNRYFTSFLQVVCNLTVAEAGYVNSTFQVVSGVLAFIVGYSIRRTGKFKWLFYVTVPMYTFGLGLMIYFRRPNQYIGYIIMCEIFISIGGSVFILLLQIAVLAAVDHQHVAAVLAMLYVTGSIGGAIGNTISGAIWTNTFFGALQRNLPASAMENLTMIYADLQTQLMYPVGSVERIAIQQAYGYGQARMLAAGVGVFALAWVWMFLLRNLNVSGKSTQTRGVVF